MSNGGRWDEIKEILKDGKGIVRAEAKGEDKEGKRVGIA